MEDPEKKDLSWDVRLVVDQIGMFAEWELLELLRAIRDILKEMGVKVDINVTKV